MVPIIRRFTFINTSVKSIGVLWRKNMVKKRLLLLVFLAAMICACQTESNNYSSERRSVSVQCKAITKKHRQCKRMTYSPNGYCSSHGGN